MMVLTDDVRKCIFDMYNSKSDYPFDLEELERIIVMFERWMNVGMKTQPEIVQTFTCDVTTTLRTFFAFHAGAFYMLHKDAIDQEENIAELLEKHKRTGERND